MLQQLDTSNALLAQLSSAIYHCKWSNAPVMQLQPVKTEQ